MLSLGLFVHQQKVVYTYMNLYFPHLWVIKEKYITLSLITLYVRICLQLSYLSYSTNKKVLQYSISRKFS
jgi:hypothetical protein